MVMSALKPTQKQELENIINKQINEEVIIKFIDEVAQASHAKKDSNFMNAKAVHLNDQEWTDIIARVFKSSSKKIYQILLKAMNPRQKTDKYSME